MGELRKGNLCLSTTYGLHRIREVSTMHGLPFASAHFIWAAPRQLCTKSSGLLLCLSTLHMGCTGKTAQRHGYSIVKCAVRG